ncbi:hypothetical protein [Vibrio pomeroyi]|uniref:hypothetical protein n=1 Tax=Vibrio pomeroyi TaxID=198832 RepID=UPI0035A5CBB4
MRKYSLSAWWIIFTIVVLTGCIKTYDLYDASRDIDRYDSRLRALNTSIFDKIVTTQVDKLSIVIKSLAFETHESEGDFDNIEKKNDLLSTDKGISQVEEPKAQEAMTPEQKIEKFFKRQEAGLEAYKTAIDDLDDLANNFEKNSKTKQRERQEIQKLIDESQKRFATSLALVVACVGISSLLISALNLILKYHRSFNYFFTHDKEPTSSSNKEVLILLNNHDKAETILSISFEKASDTCTWKTEIHSCGAEPISISAFGYIKIPIPKGFIEQTKSDFRSGNLTITTGDLNKNKGKLIGG